MYAKGGHGFGMRQQNLPADHWIDRFADWLQLQGFLKQVTNTQVDRNRPRLAQQNWRRPDRRTSSPQSFLNFHVPENPIFSRERRLSRLKAQMKASDSSAIAVLAEKPSVAQPTSEAKAIFMGMVMWSPGR
jgi:hypothetical protein